MFFWLLWKLLLGTTSRTRSQTASIAEPFQQSDCLCPHRCFYHAIMRSWSHHRIPFETNRIFKQSRSSVHVDLWVRQAGILEVSFTFASCLVGTQMSNRDLKITNVLLSKDYRAKTSGYGLGASISAIGMPYSTPMCYISLSPLHICGTLSFYVLGILG